MGIAEGLAIFAAGTAAGTLNAVVGSGSLITFPTLLAFGIAPVIANVSNNVGLVPGNASAAWGYRRELAGQRSRLAWLAIFSAAGSVAGAAALLALPPGAFKLIVPALILISCALVLAQPWLSARIAARRAARVGQEAAGRTAGASQEAGAGQEVPGGQEARGGQKARGGQEAGLGQEARGGQEAGLGQEAGGGQEAGCGQEAGGGQEISAGQEARAGQEDAGATRGGPLLAGGLFGAGVYGGYFGAAQGVLVIGLLGTFLAESLQRVNAAKNVLVGFVNGVAAVVYVIFAHVNWIIVALIAVGSTLGGLVGARVGRRLPPIALRIFIVVIGLVAAVRLIFF